jgi:hypothetical protein
VKNILGIPKEIRVVELLALGYPAGQSKPKNRNPVETIVSYDKWAF